jgi:hypothetical protein
MERVEHDLTTQQWDALKATWGNWLRRRGLDERLFLLRYLEINAVLAPRAEGPAAPPDSEDELTDQSA